MSLYRLDPAERMDPLWRRLTTFGNQPGAVRAAQARAARLGTEVTVSRIDGRTLRVVPVYRCQPGAKAKRIPPAST